MRYIYVAIESDAPWYPHLQQPPAGARLVHIGEDPAFQRYPMRSFPTDLAIKAGAAATLAALATEVASRLSRHEGRVTKRRQRLAAESETRRAAIAGQIINPGERISPHYLSHVIGEVLSDATIFNEWQTEQTSR